MVDPPAGLRRQPPLHKGAFLLRSPRVPGGFQGWAHKKVGTATPSQLFYQRPTPLAAFFPPFLCPHKEMGPPEASASLAQRETKKRVPKKAPLCKGSCLGVKRRD